MEIMDVIRIFVLACISATIGFMFGIRIQYIREKNTIITPKEITECFRYVDWTLHTFIANGIELKSIDGGTHFYKAKPIKEAIYKLNELIDSKTTKE